MAAVTICRDFGAPQNKVWHCFHFFPIYNEVMGLDAMVLVFWMSSFKPAFSLSSFTFIKRLFSSSSLSDLHIWGVDISPGSLDSNLWFIKPSISMYSAYKLNKQGDNVQPWCTPFPTWNQSIVPCPVLTVASCPAYRFLRRQIKWYGIPISLIIFHSLLWSTQSKALA